ncbi:MAG: flavin reductase [Actinobacteria bacterium]|nr:flavin reductase [Actinomycetota bacterium]
MSDFALEPGTFRDVVGRFASGVTVITARDGDVDAGMTASAVTSLSLEPPMMLVCINRSAPTGESVARAGHFAVNILRGDQGEVALAFAAPSEDKFKGIPISRGTWGEPLIDGALATIECEVVEEVSGGTHTVFLGRAHVAEAQPGSPLAYFRGGFGRLELEPDEAVYGDVRERVLSREIPLGVAFDLDDLADQIGAERQAVFHAISRLRAEGIVMREGIGRYLVTPLDETVVVGAFRARTIIERGAAEAAVGRLDADEMAGLRESLEATAPGADPLTAQWFFEVNQRFHEDLVSLGGGPLLIRAHRQLTFEGVLARTLHGTEFRADLVARDYEDHRAIVAAYEAGDVDAAKSAISAHSAHAERDVVAALAEAGGHA